MELRKATRIEPQDTEPLAKERLREADARNWEYYEFVRNFTENVTPIGTYYFLFLLAKLNLLETIITTNYDMTLESMFLRLRQYLRVGIAFDSTVEAKQADYSDSDEPTGASHTIRIWKIHGTLGHIFFRSCGSFFRSPKFPLAFDGRSILPTGDHWPSHHYSSGRQNCQERIYKQETELPCGYYVHPVDWNVPDLESNSVLKSVLTNGLQEFDDSPFAVIILGFTGCKGHPNPMRDEHLNKKIEELDGDAIRWAMLVNKEQFSKIEKDTWRAQLWNFVGKNNGVRHYGSPGQLARTLLEALEKANLMAELEMGELYDGIFAPHFLDTGYYERGRLP